MQLVEAKAITRGMVKVEPGEDLVESLETLARVAGWREAVVFGAGSLDLAELEIGDDTVTVEKAELLSLAGRIVFLDGGPKVSLCATVLVGDVTRSGRIAAAMTGGLTLVVDAVHMPSGGSATVPAPDARVGSSFGATLPAPGRSVAQPSPPGLSSGAASEMNKPPSQSFSNKPLVRPPMRRTFDLDDDDDDENPVVNTGDFLQHPQLGLCEVVGYDGSGGTKIRLTSGKVRVLKLEALRVLQGQEDEEGRMVFRVAGPRRR